jgi:DNA-binding MarR family transcriptional regulator
MQAETGPRPTGRGDSSVSEQFGILPIVSDLTSADLTAAARTLARLARIVERACCETTPSQYRVLALVASGDERATHLAGRLALAKPTITAAVDGLVERGLLTRSDVAGDRRATRLAVTAAGRVALDRTEEAIAARLAPLVAGCEHPARVIAALGELARALDARVEARA